jgi:aspartyl protease family protein
MGFQDRDYYHQKNKKAYSTNTSGKISSSLKFLLYPFLTLAILWYGAERLLDKVKNSKTVQPVSVITRHEYPDLIPGGLILKTDRQGHFRGTVLINNVAMPFLIDTGATTTSVPANMAKSAGLPLGSLVATHTAGGQVLDHQTRIDTLKMGNAEISNLDAHINQHLTEVLIGMNTLKYFHITQNGNTLTLVAYNRTEEIAEIESGLASALPENTDLPALPEEAIAAEKKAKPTWKKTVICDEQNHCKTTYSDH